MSSIAALQECREKLVVICEARNRLIELQAEFSIVYPPTQRTLSPRLQHYGFENTSANSCVRCVQNRTSEFVSRIISTRSSAIWRTERKVLIVAFTFTTLPVSMRDSVSTRASAASIVALSYSFLASTVVARANARLPLYCADLSFCSFTFSGLRHVTAPLLSSTVKTHKRSKSSNATATPAAQTN